MTRRGCGVLLYGSSIDDSGRLRCVRVIRRGGISNVVNVACSSLSGFISSRLPFIAVSHRFGRRAIYIASSGFRTNRLTMRGLIRGKYRGLNCVKARSHFPARAAGQESNFGTGTRRVKVPCTVCSKRSPMVRFGRRVQAFFRRGPSISNVFTRASFVTLSVLRILRRVGHGMPRRIRVVNYSNVGVRSNHERVMSAVHRSMSLVTGTTIRGVVRIVSNRSIEAGVALPIRCIRKPAAGGGVSGWSNSNVSEGQLLGCCEFGSGACFFRTR